MRILVFLFLFAFSYDILATDVLLVSNVKINQSELSIQKLKNLFLGTPLLDGIQPVQLTVGHPSRNTFNGLIIGMTEARIAAFWAQMRFSGTRFPPKEFDNEAELIQFMLANDNVIGYVPADMQIPQNLYIIMEL